MATFPKETLENIVLENVPNNTLAILRQIAMDDEQFFDKLVELIEKMKAKGYALRRLSNYIKHRKWVDVTYGTYSSVTFTLTKISHPKWRNNFHIGDLDTIVNMVTTRADK